MATTAVTATSTGWSLRVNAKGTVTASTAAALPTEGEVTSRTHVAKSSTASEIATDSDVIVVS
jgi:hypothetical protein